MGGVNPVFRSEEDLERDVDAREGICPAERETREIGYTTLLNSTLTPTTTTTVLHLPPRFLDQSRKPNDGFRPQ